MCCYFHKKNKKCVFCRWEKYGEINCKECREDDDKVTCQTCDDTYNNSLKLVDYDCIWETE